MYIVHCTLYVSPIHSRNLIITFSVWKYVWNIHINCPVMPSSDRVFAQIQNCIRIWFWFIALQSHRTFLFSNILAQQNILDLAQCSTHTIVQVSINILTHICAASKRVKTKFCFRRVLMLCEQLVMILSPQKLVNIFVLTVKTLSELGINFRISNAHSLTDLLYRVCRQLSRCIVVRVNHALLLFWCISINCECFSFDGYSPWSMLIAHLFATKFPGLNPFFRLNLQFYMYYCVCSVLYCQCERSLFPGGARLILYMYTCTGIWVVLRYMHGAPL